VKERRYYYVYIMASSSGTLYVGMTNAVGDRAWMHKMGNGSEFTRRYKVDRLVYYECYRYVKNAIAREKQLKGWKRSKKVALIVAENPSWRDLSKDLGKQFTPEGSGPSTPLLAGARRFAQDDKTRL
jgi:putative endonuclease